VAKVVIIGAGFAGQTAALYLADALDRRAHQITMINKYESFVYTPSLVWVGSGTMKVEKAQFPLRPVYRRKHIDFVHGTATEVHPDDQYVVVEPANGGDAVRADYDYLIIATGARLNFAATPGLGPNAEGETMSICSPPHAVRAWDQLRMMIQRLHQGERLKFVVGTGFRGATCQGAAFEYLSNIHKILLKEGVRDRAELVWFSNEPKLGDFGIGGARGTYRGKVISTEDFIHAIFEDAGIQWEIHRSVDKVEAGRILWENENGEHGETNFDFAMLIPGFAGPKIKYVDKEGNDITGTMANAGGFVKVDAIYGLSYDVLKNNPDAWPSWYQNPTYPTIFAAGIAFAPPGTVSPPHTTPNGTVIAPAVPRTGMVSGVIGRIVAKNIISMIKHGRMKHRERMSEMVTVCVASMGSSLWDGLASTLVVYPVVPDRRKYPNEDGRHLSITQMDIGLSGAWMKRLLHTTFIYKLKGYPGWKIIPE